MQYNKTECHLKTKQNPKKIKRELICKSIERKWQKVGATCNLALIKQDEREIRMTSRVQSDEHLGPVQG
jgi:hypothetical protein